MNDWYRHPLDRRAPAGGATGLDGKFYRGGTMMPFYVPRSMMPQIDEEDLPAFLDFAASRGVETESARVSPHDLMTHQRVEMAHVREMDPALLNKPILVSLDPFVLDGNHRRAAAIKQHLLDVPIHRLRLFFEEAIALIFDFPKTYTLVPGVIRN